MNNSKAIAICRDLGSSLYPDREKARAIHHVLFGRMPAAIVDADLILGVAKWLFNRTYILDL